MNLRFAELSDAHSIAAVHIATWQSAYAALMPVELLDSLSVDDRTARWDEILLRRTSITWIAEIEGRVVGFADAGASRDSDADHPVGELSALYVSAEHSGRGIGRALCVRSFGSLAQQGFRQVTAWVLADNLRARSFYERIGMRADGAEKWETLFGHSLREVRYQMEIPVSSRGVDPLGFAR